MLRTTCVATLLDGGHANNALPQRAGANINCRIFPGETVEAPCSRALVAAIGDPSRPSSRWCRRARPIRRAAAAGSQGDRAGQKLVAKYFPACR
jgi:hypothetical protein